MDDYAPLYRFFARAYLKPPDAAFLELAADSPELAPFLDDALKDPYTWLFEFNVYPYASIFLDPSGMLNAPWSGFVSGVYRALGLEVASSTGLAADDHLAAQLEALAVLCEREEKAENEMERLRARHGQRTLLLEHLLPWLPCFVSAVRRMDDGFYGALAGMTLELALNHAEGLLENEVAPAFAFPEAKDEVKPTQLIASKHISKEARVRLQELIIPARSGLFLSRADVTMMGRRLELPTRFAERVFMLEQLVASAADAGRLGQLFGEFRAIAVEQAQHYRQLGHNYPFSAPLYAVWLDKLGATKTALLQLAQAYEE